MCLEESRDGIVRMLPLRTLLRCDLTHPPWEVGALRPPLEPRQAFVMPWPVEHGESDAACLPGPGHKRRTALPGTHSVPRWSHLEASWSACCEESRPRGEVRCRCQAPSPS